MGCGAEPDPSQGAPGGWGGCILIPAWPMALGSPWSPAGPEYPEAGLEGTKPRTTTPALLDDATTTPLCAQNMEINSVIYTVFANDSDTGSASKVSYSIEEVSTGLSPNTSGISLARGSACWGEGCWGSQDLLSKCSVPTGRQRGSTA